MPPELVAGFLTKDPTVERLGWHSRHSGRDQNKHLLSMCVMQWEASV